MKAQHRSRRTIVVPAMDWRGEVRNLRIVVAPRRRYWSLWLEPGEWDAHLYPEALNAITAAGGLWPLVKAHGYQREVIFAPGSSKKAEWSFGGYWGHAKGLTEGGAMALAEAIRAGLLSIVPKIDTARCYLAPGWDAANAPELEEVPVRN